MMVKGPAPCYQNKLRFRRINSGKTKSEVILLARALFSYLKKPATAGGVPQMKALPG
jgi:hypothetical protein